MSNLKKSKIAKTIAGFVGFTMALSLVVGAAAPASAQSVEELTAQISSLLATISSLQTQLAKMQGGTTGSTGTVGAYNFAKDLQVGSRGADVTALQNLIKVSPATGYFGSITKAAVIKFQKENGISGTGYVGPVTRAKLNTMGGTTGGTTTPGTTIPTGSDVSVALVSGSSATFLAGQSLANLGDFAFKNNTANEVSITRVELERTGISTDTTVSNVYLYDGVTRLTDAASISSGKMTFNASTGIIKIAAGATKIVSVKADVAASTAGLTIGTKVTAVVAGSTTVTGLPVTGAMNSIAATPDGIATVSFAAPTPSAASIDPQNDYTMWQSTVTIGNRAVNLKSVAFRQIGSVVGTDIGNFRLFVDGVQVGSAVPSLDSNGYVTFNLSANPIKIETGSRVMKLVGDIVGGSSRTFSFSLRQAADVNVVDSQLGTNLLVLAGGSAFSAQAAGTQTIGTGSLSISKKTDSPSGNVVNGAAGIVLGKFEVKAAGEPIKVEQLTVTYTQSDTDFDEIRNGALFANGVQIGSTADISISGTTYNLGSSLIVTPGSPVTLEVRGDVYDGGDATNSASAGDTIKVSVALPASAGQRMNSLTYLSAISAVDGNTLTIAEGTLSGAKFSSYGNQTITDGKTAFKIGDFRVTAGATEDINLNTITVEVRQNNTTDIEAADITDLYVKYGNKTTSVKSTIASDSGTYSENSWSISETIAKNSTLPFEVYATLNTDPLAGSTTIAYLTVSGTTAGGSAASATTGRVTGQTITIQSGSITAATVSDATLATKLLVGGTTEQKVASFRLTALNEDYKVTAISLSTQGANSNGAITRYTLKSGGVVLGTGDTFNTSNTATTTSLSLKVPANNSAGTVVDVYLNLNEVAANAATSTADVKMTLLGFDYEPWSGGTSSYSAQSDAANSMYVVKAAPIVENVLTNGTLVAGAGQTIAKVKVTADGGTIGWKKMTFTINKTSAVTIGATSTLALYDSNNNAVAGTFSTTTGSLLGGLDALGVATSGTVNFVADSEQQISTSETYQLRGTIGGLATGYNYVSAYVSTAATSIATPDAYATVAGAAGTQTPHFVWTDRSANSHDTTTADWLNDYKVKGLPTGAATLSVSI